jgi:hypothetical protein
MSVKQLKTTWGKRAESSFDFVKKTKLSVPDSLQKRKEVLCKNTELI